MSLNPQLILILGGGLFMILIAVIAFSGGEHDTLIKKRIERVGGAPVRKQKKKGQEQAKLLKETKDSNFVALNFLIKTFLPNPQKLRHRLACTGRNIGLGEYLMVNTALVGTLFFVFAFIIMWPRPIATSAAIAIGLLFPHMVTGSMIKRRLKKFNEGFPEAIDTICRGLRSGLPITETVATVGRELPDPIGIEFTRISDGVKMGRSIEEAMWEVAPRLDTPEYRFFIIALAIQRETGGNLAETLGNLADLLRKRRQLKLKIKAMSSEARSSAMIIGSLPFLMFTMLMFVNPDYVMTLFNTSGGRMLLAGGLTWLSMGVLVMRQMVNFEI
ncbi:MAG: type II secretion system F family protein [Alphaproteobacteria bacterium]|nr:type II secretion system F family protein [Alphaproteobacteria bacterium]